MKDRSPCIDCKDRYPGCQGRCDKGITYFKQRKAKKEVAKAAKSFENMIANYKISRIVETKEKAGIK
mgnify:CR=1 FL=1